jgi:PAS domain S-box-containing protein
MGNVLLLGMLLILAGGLIAGAVWYFLTSRSKKKAGNEPAGFGLAFPEGDAHASPGLIVLDETGRPVFVDEASRILLDLGAGSLESPTASGVLEQLKQINGATTLRFNGKSIRVFMREAASEEQRATILVLREEANSRSETARPQPGPDLAAQFSSFSLALDQIESQEDLIDRAIEGLLSCMPADVIEINLFDEMTGNLVPHRGYSPGSPAGPGMLEEDVYRLGEGYTGWLLEHNTSLRISETRERTDIHPKTGLPQFPYHSYLGTPICSQERVLGTIELAAFEPDRFTGLHESLLEGIAAQAAYVLLHLELMGRHLRSEAEYDGLLNLFAKLPEELDVSSLNEVLTQEIARLVNVTMIGIYIYEDAHQTLVPLGAPLGLPTGSPHLAGSLESPPEGPLSSVWRTQDFWLSVDIPHDASVDAIGLREMFTEAGVQQAVIVPLSAGQERLGLIIAANRISEHAFQPEDTHMLLFFGARCGPIVQLCLSIDRGQRRVRSVAQPFKSAGEEGKQGAPAGRPGAEALMRIATELSANLDLDQVLARALVLVQEILSADQGAILLIAEDSDQLILRASFGSPEALPPGGRPSPYSSREGLAGWVIRNRQPTIINDLSADERWIPYNDDVPKQKSALVVPLIAGDEAIGALILLSRERAGFEHEDIRLMSAAANQIASAIQNAALYSLIKRQAERLGLMVRTQQVESSKSRAILESIADGVIVTDDEHTIVLFNPAAERILGLAHDDVVGAPVFRIMGVYGPAGRRWSETIQAWKDAPLQVHTWEDHTEKITLEDDRVISIRPAPVVLGDEFLGTVSIFRDITRDVEVDRLKSEFVATVSHELRTPMTSIKGFVDLMLIGASGTLTDEQRRFLQIVQTNTERLEILVNDLLDISRIEAGKVTLRFEAIDVRTLIHDVETYLTHLQREAQKQMRVVTDIPGDLPQIWGDLERARQIISNIAENSFHYTPAGGTISISASHTGDEIEIVIADDGIGISLAEQERIFERFYRGEQALNMGVPGTGLGLSIALNLIGMHDGRVWVSSEGVPGKGTTFTVAFPTGGERVEYV